MTLTVTVEVPALLALPLITPVVLFRDSPAGSLPEAIVHVYGVDPPVAASLTEYATFLVATGSGDVVVICKGTVMVKLKALSDEDPIASVTLTVKLEVPPTVGVPLMTPDDDTLRPEARLPLTNDHVYGVDPPVAAKVLE